LFIAIALVSAVFADLSISTIDPWAEMSRLALGLLTPDVGSLPEIASVMLSTIGFAFLGVFLGSASGFGLALLFRYRTVRIFCALVRAIHELFWALIFLQFFGLHPLTGLLAIAIPYAGIFAKVYSEILEESETSAVRVLPAGTGRLSEFLYARLPDALPHLASYTWYRLECGLRSSAVLGFVGLPTLGFLLESAFGEGRYSEVGAMLFVFFLLIASIRWWARPKLLPIYLAISPFCLGTGLPIVWSSVGRFWTEDIIPAPLRQADVLLSFDTLQALGRWFGDLLWQQALPGLWNTLLLTQMTLVVTGLLTVLWFPLISRWFGNWLTRLGGHWLLVVLRSTPEYILAYALLQLWGPSMLPAVVALALHNGAIIAHLIGRQSDALPLRLDHCKGVNLYLYELVPGLYRSTLAFLFYRWEIIMRETAILGILGIYTLGFYIDSAIQGIRFDRAFVLILLTAMVNILIDVLSRRLRAHLKLRAQVRCDG
jgi:phosphonate transport system permease protein